METKSKGIYRVKFNDYGVRYVVAGTFREAEDLFFSRWLGTETPLIKEIGLITDYTHEPIT